ncbi:uncharacterized protein SOCEGT47_007950 [Sorangium cellulosum]|uniref:Uncharacterized protein n=1 Tax=Sorangium cellulosum TaxID=56 RepID=A0A4P2PUG6_SORCE|nr:hypothetical protein [Sorangium cellulosum]AUX20327.1 uncharacterized protein SOCEGT47_007950 [Sorangium cellulosum]
MKSFAEKLGESGELVAAEGLAGPEQAKLVRAGKDGRPITDGVLPEAKEFLAGYGSWTSRAPSAPTRSPGRRPPRPVPAARRSTWGSRCERG